MTNLQLDTLMKYSKRADDVIHWAEFETVKQLVEMGLLERFEKSHDKRNPYGYVRPTPAGKDLRATQVALLSLTDKVLTA